MTYQVMFLTIHFISYIQTQYKKKEHLIGCNHLILKYYKHFSTKKNILDGRWLTKFPFKFLKTHINFIIVMQPADSKYDSLILQKL